MNVRIRIILTSTSTLKLTAIIGRSDSSFPDSMPIICLARDLGMVLMTLRTEVDSTR